MPTGCRTTLNGVTIAGVTYWGVVDLETVFHPRGGTAPAPNVGFRSADTRDLADWFYPRSAGGETLEVDVGYRNAAATDLRHIFAKNGTVSGRGGDGGGCLPFDTPVMLWSEGTKPLGELRPGDEVIGYYADGMIDESGTGWLDWTMPADAAALGLFIPSTVVLTMVSTYPAYYLINGELRATFEHPFLVLRDGLWRWIRAEHLQPGDAMLTDDFASPIFVEECVLVQEPLQVANINVEQVDNYFVQAFGRSVLTHNSVNKN